MKPNTPRLQKYKRNQIVEAIQAVGLDPREFEIVEDEAESKIEHKQSSALFTIGGGPSKYLGQYVSGDWPPLSYVKYTWEGVMTSMDVWLYDVKRDLETPDLWAEATKAEFDEAWGESNKSFSPKEIILVTARMEDVRTKLLQVAGEDEDLINDINTKVNYLIKAAHKMGRKDWAMMAIGYMFNNVANCGLTADHFAAVVHLIITVGTKLIS